MKFHGFSKTFQGVPGGFQSVPGISKGYKVVPRVFQRISGSYMGIPGGFQRVSGIFTERSQEFQERFSGVQGGF